MTVLLLRDLLGDPVLRGHRVLCAHDRVGTRRVDWFSVIEWPVEDFVQADEVVMTTALGCDAPQFVDLVRQVLDARPAALLFTLSEGAELSEAPAAAIELATAAGIPLVELPWRIRFAEIARTIADQRGRPTSAELSTGPGALDGAFVSALLGGGGHQAIADVAEAWVDAPVVVLAADLQVAAAGQRAQHELADVLPAVRARIAALSTADLLAIRRLTDSPATAAEAIARIGLPAGRLAVAGGAARSVRGYVYAHGPADSAAVEAGLAGAAHAAAVEQVRSQAVLEATIQAHGELLWTIARGDLGDPEEIDRRAARAGYGRGSRFVVAVGLPATGSAAPNDEVTIDAVALPRLRRHGVHASRTEDGVLVVAPAGGSPALATLLRDAPGASWGIADGTVTLAELRDGYVRARDTAVATTIIARGGVRHQHELGAYLLLTRLQSDEVTGRVVQEVLGPLLEYDRRTSRDLTHSLAVYLGSNGNTSASARELHLNRHSLLYRLRKIEALTGRDLEQADDRFLLSLVLRLWQLERVARHGAAAQASRPG